MKTAIIAWGSLYRDPRNITLVDGWHRNGPVLPIEFSRISKCGNLEGCLTLVVDERKGTPCPTYYGISTHEGENLDVVIDQLKVRENITNVNRINYIKFGQGGIFSNLRANNNPTAKESIVEWARFHHVDAVVWTGLGPRFKDVLNIPFTNENAMAHLNGLPVIQKVRALEYIFNAPESSMTSFKRFLINHEQNLTNR